jgi:hypothetical protein
MDEKVILDDLLGEGSGMMIVHTWGEKSVREHLEAKAKKEGIALSDEEKAWHVQQLLRYCLRFGHLPEFEFVPNDEQKREEVTS